MRKILITLFLCIIQAQLFGQTEQDVISEANRLDISSREQAISALASKGVSLSQAKEMAELRGVDFDAF
jgi:hypothetical protein